jgi:hypothetical protein
MSIFTRSLPLVAAGALFLSGCGEDATSPSTPANEPPALPPLRTMQPDLHFFGDGEEAQRALESRSAETEGKLNFLNAAVRVAFVNVAVLTALTPPAEAFAIALGQDPVVQDDESFLWSYDYVGNEGERASIRLRGRLEGIHVEWEMRVSSTDFEPPVEDLLWFTGESSLLEDSGFWVFNDLDREEAARVEWTHTRQLERAVFVNLDADSEGVGDRLTFEDTGDVSSLVYHDASTAIDGTIIWNERTGEGSIEVPDYRNGEKSCWDSRQFDVECPSDPA